MGHYVKKAETDMPVHFHPSMATERFLKLRGVVTIQVPPTSSKMLRLLGFWGCFVSP